MRFYYQHSLLKVRPERFQHPQKSPVKRQGQDQAGENYSVILRIAKPVMSMTFSLSTV